MSLKSRRLGIYEITYCHVFSDLIYNKIPLDSFAGCTTKFRFY